MSHFGRIAPAIPLPARPAPGPSNLEELSRLAINDLPGLASTLCDVVRGGLHVSLGVNGLGEKAGTITRANLALGYQGGEVLRLEAL
jgi:hypothetical protein